MNLIKNIKQDFTTIPQMFLKYDSSAKSYIEIILLYPGFKAIIFHRFAHLLWNNNLHFCARLISEFSRFITMIEIHPGAQIGSSVMIDHGGNTVIGETAIIGNNVIIFHHVTLGSYKVGVTGKRHPVIGNDVVIGVGSSILGNITIASKSKIKCGSYITKSINNIKVVK